MTNKQRADIVRLRSRGMMLSEIAEVLNLPIGTIKSVVYRNIDAMPEDTVCLQCGKTIIQTSHRKQKKFCCKSCRMKWWNAHPDQGEKRIVYRFKCAECGMTFACYGNRKRKYCCRACFFAAQNRKVAND